MHDALTNEPAPCADTCPPVVRSSCSRRTKPGYPARCLFSRIYGGIPRQGLHLLRPNFGGRFEFLKRGTSSFSGACYDRGIPFFGENGFRMTGLLNPKSSEIRHLFLHDSRCVPRPRDVSSGSSYDVFPNQFLGQDVLRSQTEEPQRKTRGAPLS